MIISTFSRALLIVLALNEKVLERRISIGLKLTSSQSVVFLTSDWLKEQCNKWTGNNFSVCASLYYYIRDSEYQLQKNEAARCTSQFLAFFSFFSLT